MWFFEKGSELKIIFIDCVNLQRVFGGFKPVRGTRVTPARFLVNQDGTKNCLRSKARLM